MSTLAPTLQTFFTDRLVRQRQASPHTVAAYRDALRLLVRFSSERLNTEASKLDIGDLDAALISAFLDHREHDRGNSIRTRNARLVAIRALFRYAALRHPEHAAVIARVLAIPPKRFERRLITFLTEPEVEALLAAPGRTTWTGRRESHPACARGPDGATRVGADWPARHRRPPGHRSAHQLSGQRAEATDHAAHHVCGGGVARLAL